MSESILKEQWDIEIKPQEHLFKLDFKAVWRYRDLLLLLVRRDFVAQYKQTILGPIWFFIQPLLTTITYVVIFGRMAQIKTDGLPEIPFYIAGVICWGYFSEALTKTSDTFITNASIFGKVYFPRLVIPLSIVISSLIRLGVQFLLFFVFWVYYLVTDDRIQPHWELLWLIPIVIVLMGGLGLGLGIIFSSLTTKYRDLRFLLTFGIQLAMFATPVVYPLSLAPAKYTWMIVANPFTSVIETFRYVFLGKGQFEWSYLLYSAVVTIIILLIGATIFNKVEKNFMDTV